MAQYERFPATFDNVIDYVNATGILDDSLARVLTAAGSITEISGANEEEKRTSPRQPWLRENLSSPVLRAKLVESLGLRGYLSVSDIEGTLPTPEGAQHHRGHCC